MEYKLNLQSSSRQQLRIIGSLVIHSQLVQTDERHSLGADDDYDGEWKINNGILRSAFPPSFSIAIVIRQYVGDWLKF